MPIPTEKQDGSSTSFTTSAEAAQADRGRFIIVKMEGLDLEEGAEVPQNLWEPLLGGELHALWNELLVDEGDEIYVKGSTIFKMLMGGYVVDSQTGLADPRLRSDIDVVLVDEKVKGRAANSKYKRAQTAVSTTFEIGTLQVGAVDMNELMIQNYDAIVQLSTQIKFPSQSFEDPLQAWLQVYQGAHNESALYTDTLYKHEGVMLKLKREHGELKAFIHDNNNILGEHGTNIFLKGDEYISHDDAQLYSAVAQQESVTVDKVLPSVYTNQINLYRQAQQTHEMREDTGLILTNVNQASAQALLIEACAHTKKALRIRGANRLPLYTLNGIPRLLTAASELDVDLLGNGDTRYFYAEIWTLADRLAKHEEVFSLDPSVYSKHDKELGLDSAESWFTYKLHGAFARSCATDMRKAYANIFMNLPLSGFVSADLEETFTLYNKTYKYNNQSPYYFDEADELPYNSYINWPFGEDLFLHDLPAIEAYRKFSKLCGLVYGDKEISMYGISSDEQAIRKKVLATHPGNMSQVMALVLTSVNWDAESDKDKISKLVSNWTQTGNIGLSWKLESFDFDTSLDENLVSAYMKALKEYD